MITSTTERITKNIGYLFFGNIIVHVIYMVIWIILPRYIGAVNLGKYTFATAFTGIFSILCKLGFETLAIKEVSQDKSSTSQYLNNILILKVLLAILAYIILLVTSLLLNKQSVDFMIVSLIGISIIFVAVSDALRWSFKAYQIMEYDVLISIIQAVLTLVFILIVILNGYGVVMIAFFYSFSNFLVTVITFYFVLKYIKFKFQVQFELKFMKLLFKQTLPFAFGVIFTVVLMNINTIMLSFIKGDAAVGWYSIALNVSGVTKLIPVVFLTALLPPMSEFAKYSFDKLSQVFKKSTYFMFLLGLPLAVGTSFLSDKIIYIFFGDGFRNSVIPLKILIWSSGLSYVNTVSGTVLVAVGKQKINTIAIVISLFFVVVFNILLIPSIGHIGTSITLVLAELIATIITFTYIKYKIGLSIFQFKYLKVIISTIIMLAFIYLIRDINIIFIVVFGVIIYFAALFILNGLSLKA